MPNAREFRAALYDSQSADVDVRVRLAETSRDPGVSLNINDPFTDLARLLISAEKEPKPGTAYPLEAIVRRWDGPSRKLDLVARVEESLETISLAFGDGSSDRYHSLERVDPRGLDTGTRLLEPITVHELRGVERILSQLEHAIESAELTAFQEQRILTMANFIREARIEAEPEETPRWRIVGVVRAGLRYALKELPRDGLAFVKFVEILDDVAWTDIARSLL